MSNTIDDAVGYLQNGNYTRGTQILERLRRSHPDDVIILYNLGMAYSEQGRLDESAEVLEKAVTLDPDFANAHSALGFTYARQGKHATAIQVTRRALALAPDNFTGWRNLGGLLAQNEQWDEAVEALGKAYQLQKDDPQVLYGMAMAEQGRGNIAEASRLYKRLIQQNRHPQLVHLAEQAMSRIAHEEMRSRAVGGLRMDAVMYMLGALDKFAKLESDEVRNVGFEIAMLGRQGLDINDPEPKYQLRCLQGRFSGLQLLSYMHVAFQQIEPSLDVGSNLDAEYQTAQQLWQTKSGETRE